MAILKPRKPGSIIRDPITKTQLSEHGEEKSLSTFWKRRLKDRDVVNVGRIEKQHDPPKSSDSGSKLILSNDGNQGGKK